MRKFHLSIRWKLIISIILPLILIASIVMGFTLSRIYEFGSENIQTQGLRELNLYAERLDAEFQSLARIAQDTATFLNIIGDELTREDIYEIITLNVSQNPLIYGSAVAFEPFAFNPEIPLFSPYVYGSNPELNSMDVALDAYDYSDGTWEWFSAVKENQAPVWTEPYFDEGAGDVLMVTYSVPFYIDDQFRGVATIDVPLDRMQTEASLALDNQYFAIHDKTGRYISHYNSDLIMSSSIQDQAALMNNQDYQRTVENILAGETGIGVVNDYFLNGEIVDGESWIFYSPITSTGWNLSTTIPEATITSELRALINFGLIGLALMILLILIFVSIISTRITRPIKNLANAVSDVARGKLDTPISNIRSMDELGRLSIGFNRMLKNLKKQIKIQSQQTAERQIVEKEMQVARQTQRSLLPTEFPPFPDRKEFELHAMSQAARHVAGDFFDFFLINPKTLIFVMADVSGKGMSAALVMAVTRTIIRNLAKSGKNPAQILAETNARLIEGHKGAAFVTIFLGMYNTSNGKILYANGGHCPPFKISKNAQVTSVGEPTGTIVGMLENQEYLNAELRLQPGETLFLYTDGFPEARAPSGEFYGDGKIKSLLEKEANQSPLHSCEDAIKEVCAFQDHNLADDITILALKRSPTRISTFISDLMKSNT
jgi:phosphoserine phosphatase RsbU/P